MNKVIVKVHEWPKLRDPILIEGLPGLGYVGKLSAEHLIRQLGGKKFATIISSYLPPQVYVMEGGTISIVKQELYYIKDRAKRDLVVLVGDSQGLNAEGQYELSYRVLELAQELGVSEVITLGGYSIGKRPEKPRVFGAATHPEIVEEVKKYGVIFAKSEPSGGIIGAAGLLIGLGMELFGMKGFCLMGETAGMYVDPRGAMEVLKVLSRILDIELNLSDLEAQAAQIEEITHTVEEIMRETEREEGGEELGYIR